MRSVVYPAKFLSLLVFAGLIGGCTTLPASGPTANQILQSAREAQEIPAFVVRDLSIESARALRAEEVLQSPDFKPLTMLPSTRPTDLVGPGDVLDIRIFEVGVSLFGALGAEGSTASMQTPTARGESFAGIGVDSNGRIRLPYLGEIEVAQLTPGEIGRLIAQRMRSKSQSPQVLVNVAESLTNVAYLSGAVAKPGKYELAPVGTRLLDVIARSGGVEGLPEDISVTLTRGDRTVEQPLSLITPGTEDDIRLQPGDRIRINKRPRTFTVFGAAGKVSQINFGSSQVTLAEAIAQAAGPSDATADATAVFLFRVATDRSTPDGISRVIYRLNLMDPRGYFVAQEFRMRDKDLIYVANARSNQANKFIALVGQLFAPAVTARALTR